jgi:hypothetical protein
MAQLIIYRFEVIEVEENHGEGVPEPIKAADFLLQRYQTPFTSRLIPRHPAKVFKLTPAGCIAQPIFARL